MKKKISIHITSSNNLHCISSSVNISWSMLALHRRCLRYEAAAAAKKITAEPIITNPLKKSTTLDLRNVNPWHEESPPLACLVSSP